MITVSEKMKAYLLQTGRTFKGKIEVGTAIVYDGIMSILTDKSVCADCMTLGAVNCSYAEFAVYGSQIDFAGKEIIVYISAVIDGADEWIKLGKFIAEKPQIEDSLVTFTAYDCIKYKTNNIYFPSASLPEEAPIDSVFADVCGQCGIKFVSLFPHTEEADKPKIQPAVLSGYKCNAVLGQIAGFLGGNIVCNNEGEIEVRTFAECDYTIDESMFSFPTIGEDIFILKKITCKTSDRTFISGNADGQGIEFENLLMTQERLDGIFEVLQGITFQGVSVENLVGNPCIQAGDIITMQYKGKAYKVPVMHVITDFDGGVMNRIEAFVKTTEEEKSDFDSISEVVKDIAQTTTKESSEFAKTINGALGLYTSKQTMTDGSVKVYYHNAENIAESTYIYTRTSEGIAFTTGENCWNNGAPVWNYGIDKDGNAILNFLRANKINADLIEAGVIKSVNQYNGEPVMQIDLNNGKINLNGTTEVITGEDEKGLPITETIENLSSYSKDGVSFKQGDYVTSVSSGGFALSQLKNVNLPVLGEIALPMPKLILSPQKSYFSKDMAVNVRENLGITNTELWSGAWYMDGAKTAWLKEKISDQPNGIVLVFSAYDIVNDVTGDFQFQSFFIPKYMVAQKPGVGYNFMLTGNSFERISFKYLFISDKLDETDKKIKGAITGHNLNVGSGSKSGITYNNKYFVLRYVIGV